MGSLRAVLKALLGLINKLGYKTEEVNVSISFSLPSFFGPKPKLVDLKWLKNKGDKDINYIIMHHTTTSDNPKTFDWDAIDRYHRSFRWNWESQVSPVALLPGQGTGDLYEYNDNWYQKAEVEAFYSRVSILTGYPIPIGKSIQQVIHGNNIETPWMMIGYNLGIEEGPEGLVLKYGRNLIIPGAHCPQMNMNRQSIGICTVGDYDKASPDSERWKMALRLCWDIMTVYPKVKILGHHEVEGVLKTCPGKLWDMDLFRSDLQKGEAALSTAALTLS